MTLATWQWILLGLQVWGLVAGVWGYARAEEGRRAKLVGHLLGTAFVFLVLWKAGALSQVFR